MLSDISKPTMQLLQQSTQRKACTELQRKLQTWTGATGRLNGLLATKLFVDFLRKKKIIQKIRA